MNILDEYKPPSFDERFKEGECLESGTSGGLKLNFEKEKANQKRHEWNKEWDEHNEY